MHAGIDPLKLMQLLHRLPLRWAADCIALGLVVVFCLFRGHQTLQEWRPYEVDHTASWLVTSVMIASGRGAVGMEPNEEIAAFLRFETQSLDWSALEGDIVELPLDFYQQAHLYMSYVVGLSWRLFGIHWDVVKYLLIGLCGLSALLLYALARLGMGPFLSMGVAVAAVTNPILLGNLHSLRDYSRMPFYLGALLLCGLLLSKRRTPLQAEFIASLLGVVVGVGKGFRDDMLVLFLICLPIVALHQGKGASVRRRLMSFGPYFFIALCIGLPTIVSDEVEGRNLAQNSISILCGFSDICESGMGMTPVSYRKAPLLTDDYAIFAAQAAAENGSVMSREALEELRNDDELLSASTIRYLTALAATFPADMLTRAVGACVALFQFPYFMQSSLTGLPRHWGIFFVLAGLLVIAARSPYRASLLLVALLALCGYTSLQFLARHVCHLYFIPFWFAGFVLHRCWRGLLATYKAQSALPGGWGRGMLRSAARALCWSAAVLGILLPVYGATILYQKHAVAALAKDYAEAPRTLATHVVSNWNGRALFSVMSGDCENSPVFASVQPSTATMYMLDLEADQASLDLRFEYESAPSFTHDLDCSPAQGHSGRQLLFFSVYEYAEHSCANRFMGVSLPEEQRGAVRGFYRVNPDGLLPLTMILPEDPAAFLSYQRVQCPWTSIETLWRGLYDLPGRLQGVFEKDALAAVAFPESAAPPPTILAAPSALQRIEAIVTLDATGQEEECLRQTLSLLDDFEGSPSAYRLLFRKLRDAGATPLLSRWEQLHAARPENKCLRNMLRYVLLHVLLVLPGDNRHVATVYPYLEQAEEILADLVAVDPRHRPAVISIHAALARHCLSLKACEEAVRLFRQTVALDTRDLSHYLGLADALRCMGEDDEALTLYRLILSQAPEFSMAAAHVDAIYDAQNNAEARLEEWRTLVVQHPEAVTPRIHLGRARECLGDDEGAFSAFQRAFHANPEHAAAMYELGRIKLLRGESEAGIDLMDKAAAKDGLLANRAAQDYCAAARPLLARGECDVALLLFNKTREYRSQDLFHLLGLAQALLCVGQEEEALGLFQKILLAAPESPVAAEQLDSIFTARNDAEGRLRVWRELVQTHPEALVPKLHLCKALEAAGALEEALDCRKESLTAAPEDRLGRYELGRLFIARGKVDAGVAAMEQAADEDPAIAMRIGQDLGAEADALLEKGLCEAAAALYLKAMEHASQNLAHYLGLAEAKICLGQDDEALHACRTLLARAPESPKAAGHIDALWSKRGSSEGRLGEWRTLVDLNPSAVIPRLHLAMALEAAGREEEAHAAYLTALATILTRLRPA